MKVGYLGIDQLGNFYTMDRYPRKELMERIGIQHANKMYVDTKSGESKHIGYVIGRHWIQVYEVHDWEK